MTFIAVDPGGACLAYAVFVDGVLVEAGLSRTAEKDTFDRALVHRKFVDELRARYLTSKVVCEAMWWIKRRGAPAQDLVNLNLIAGAVGTEWYLPHVWKGKLPKEVHHPRVFATLREDEKKIAVGVMPKYLRHNSTDAIGIGLYHLKRLTPTCKTPLTSSTTKPSAWPPARLSASSAPRAPRTGKKSRARSSKRTKASSTPSTRSKIRVLAVFAALG